MKSWDDIETRRNYLIGMGFDVNKVANATDEWVLKMTSPLPTI